MNKLFLIMIGFSMLFLAACGGQTLAPEPRVTQAPKLATPLPLVTPRPVLTQTTAPASPTTAMGQIANPASKNCIAKGGKLDIRKDANGGEYGMCVFPEWKRV
jgi:putative hemolysin